MLQRAAQRYKIKISRLKRQNEIFIPNRAIRAPVLPAQRNLMRVRRILTPARIAHALRRSYKFKFQIPPINLSDASAQKSKI